MLTLRFALTSRTARAGPVLMLTPNSASTASRRFSSASGVGTLSTSPVHNSVRRALKAVPAAAAVGWTAAFAPRRTSQDTFRAAAVRLLAAYVQQMSKAVSSSTVLVGSAAAFVASSRSASSVGTLSRLSPSIPFTAE